MHMPIVLLTVMDSVWDLHGKGQIEEFLDGNFINESFILIYKWELFVGYLIAKYKIWFSAERGVMNTKLGILRKIRNLFSSKPIRNSGDDGNRKLAVINHIAK